MEAAELNEQLDQIGVAAMEFKRAANNNRESMSNIVRDISSYFQSQKNNNDNVEAAIESLGDELESNARKIEDTNSLLKSSVNIQNQMLQQLGILNNSVERLADRPEPKSQPMGGSLSSIAIELAELAEIVPVVIGAVTPIGAAALAIGGAVAALVGIKVALEKFFPNFEYGGGLGTYNLEDEADMTKKAAEEGERERKIHAENRQKYGFWGGTWENIKEGFGYGDKHDASSEQKNKNYDKWSSDAPVKPRSASEALGVNESSLPAGMRNNNPGNIKWNDSVKWDGSVGPSKNLDEGTPQVVFNSPEMGMRAMALNLMNYQNKYHLDTISQIMSRYSPSNAKAAIKNISDGSGIGPDEKINLNDPATLQKIMRAVLVQEQGDSNKLYKDSMISKGISLATAPTQERKPNENDISNNTPVDNNPANTDALTGVSLDGVNPSLVSNLSKAATEFFQRTGKKVIVNSGKRSTERQAQLYDAYIHGRSPYPAARPGTSMHEKGLAVDIDVNQAAMMDQLGILRKYGLDRPVQGDPVHIQLSGSPAEEKGPDKSVSEKISPNVPVQNSNDNKSIAPTPMPNSPMVPNDGSPKPINTGALAAPAPPPLPMPSPTPSPDSTVSQTVPSLTSAVSSPTNSDDKKKNDENASPPTDFLSELNHWLKSSHIW